MSGIWNDWSLRLIDVIDILAVATLLYLILSWLSRRASRALLIAAASGVLVYVAAEELHMYLTSLLFRAGATALLVTLVLVFQEDIRRAVGQLVAWRPRPRPTEGPDAVIDALVEAAAMLANQSRGALIALEGREAVERHVDGGVPVDGAVSALLLSSIFDPNSPGHDGAVLIRNGVRLSHFGVHLPLTRNHDEVGSKGTRHAAALGLAERSDALVIVVSEERGAISVAEAGRLRPIDTPIELRKQIERFFQRSFDAAAPRGWPRSLLQNLSVKLGALGLALLIWLVFAGKVDTVQRTFAVPIEFRNLPPGWQTKAPETDRALVALVGQERDFDQLDAESLRVSLDLSGVTPGAEEIPLTEKSLNHPQRLSVARIEPPTMRVRVFRLETITLPVRPLFEGTPAGGMALIGYSVTPETIRVRMPRSAMQATTVIRTEPIDLSRISESAQVEGNLSLPDDSLLEPGQPATVRVALELIPRPTD